MNLYDFKKQIILNSDENYYVMETLSEIEEGLNSLSNTTLIGNEFEDYAKQFFNYKLNINTYALHEVKDNDNDLFDIVKIIGVENVSDIKDMGIDLMGRSGINNIHFVQVKYHSDLKTIIAWRDVTTFISLVSLFENNYRDINFDFYIFY